MSSIQELETVLGAHDAVRLKAAASRFLFRKPRADEFANAARLFEAQAPAGGSASPVKVAVLGDVTTHLIAAAAPVVLGSLGVNSACWEASFDTWRMELLDPQSAYARFAPQFALLALSSRGLTVPPAFTAKDEMENRARACVDDLCQMWQAAGRDRGTTIIQHNFALPPERPAGRLESRYEWTRRCFFRRINELLWSHEGAGVRILDVESLAAKVGEASWSDPRWYFHSKHAFSPKHTGDYALALRGTLAASLGKSHKVLVTDLDETFWGGVLGDLGPEHIEIGPGTAKGEAHLDYACYLKSLKERGVILAINSRNTPAVVERAFKQCEHLPLKLADFAAIHCHWESKSAHLRQIAAELNVGIDSLVFVDDDPMQREEVRLHCPEVCVLEFPQDVSYLVRDLDQLQLFDVTALTADDAGRTETYHAAAQLRDAGPTDIQGFLTGLAMNGRCREAADQDLDRAEALLLKTNQFNLTQKSFTRDELRRLTADGGLVFVAEMQDRLTKYGTVSILVGKPDNGAFNVLNWVMSCRVFSRTLEHYILNQLIEWSRQRGLQEVRGSCTSSGRNQYALAFIHEHAETIEQDDGSHAWRIETSRSLPSFVG